MARLSKDSSSWHAVGMAKRNEDWENEKKSDHKGEKRKKKTPEEIVVCRDGGYHQFTTGFLKKPDNATDAFMPIQTSNAHYTRRDRCKICGLDGYTIQKAYGKIKHQKKLEEIKTLHESDGIKSHLFEWQLTGEIFQQDQPRYTTEWRGRIIHGCPYFRNGTLTRAFKKGLTIVEWEKKCISCGTVDKIVRLIEGDTPN